MKSRVKDWITVFLIQLVITIPFYTTSVYAATTSPIDGSIDQISVAGSDGINGFAKSEDFLRMAQKHFKLNQFPLQLNYSKMIKLLMIQNQAL